MVLHDLPERLFLRWGEREGELGKNVLDALDIDRYHGRLFLAELQFLPKVEELQEKEIFKSESFLRRESILNVVGEMDVPHGVLQVREIVACEDLVRDPFGERRIRFMAHADREPDAARREASGFGIDGTSRPVWMALASGRTISYAGLLR